MRRLIFAAAAAVLLSASLPAGALHLRQSTAGPQLSDPGVFKELRWRHIGPFRGGRTKAASGVPGQPNVFYIAATNGGVWKTTDYGIVWKPIFDEQPTGSIGALAVAPSNASIIYVGSGEGLQRPDLSTGDGIYKSTDAGKTWTHLGLRDGQQIPQIIVDPRNPDRLFVAVLGHPYGPNEERGIFRSTDGAKTFQKVLYKDADTGGVDLAFDPSNADHVYAVLWQARQGPWENGVFSGPGSGLFESTDGGTTWKPLTRGLPTFDQGLGRIGIAIAPSDPKRMYAAVQAGNAGGLFRSDDAGQSWHKVTENALVVSRGDDFAEVKVHPKNPDIVFTGSIVAWKSTDGGRTFKSLRGAPGGDDYHRFWINPDNPDIILIAADQGAVITVNGGETWSTWYNQPTAQFYHVSTDNAFPYRVCGGQQESGSACVQSRSDDGRITFREWHPVGVEEYGYVAPDPLDPDIVYGGKVSRYDRRTGEVIQVGPRPPAGEAYRVVRTQPVLFSPIEPRTLYFASNRLWKTTSGGLRGWTAISPDLTRKTWEAPANVGIYRNTPAAAASQRGVIYTIAPGYTTVNRIWVGTDDGLIHTTADGGVTWKDVTPRELSPWAKVSIIDASHTNPLGAYAAINTFRLDDLRPHIYRTRDGGKSWTRIVNGLPDGAIINAVKEDPKKPGLLFAGSETQVHVSFDDGGHWHSLRQNMPAISIRDLVIKDDDLVVGTHGRGFWILDGISSLRQIEEKTFDADAVLFKPGTAIRFEWNKNTDTPLPPWEPAGQNPPDGAILEYFLKRPANGVVTLELLDAAGATIRKYASSDTAPEIRDEGNVPYYWIRPTRILSADAGLHRFVWDMHYPPPAGSTPGYSIAATPGDTAADPKGPWVVPGTYTVKLTADGRSYTQPLVVKMDPRVKSGTIALQQQFALSKRVYDALGRIHAMLPRIGQARDRAQAAGHADLAQKLQALAGAGGGRGGRGGGRGGPPQGPPTLSGVSAQLLGIYGATQRGSSLPPTQTVAAVNAALAEAAKVLAEAALLLK
ncbi:MAG TPA: hypothetical protein VFK57_03605 [Vicinamibacterales bacterium]|nr:hypothetical protein [Vicinamibacterales bacterium]